MADPSLASTLRAVVEARKAATPGPWRASAVTVWKPEHPEDPTDFSGVAVAWAHPEAEDPAAPDPNADFIVAAGSWVESHGEAAAAALERAQAVEEAARALVQHHESERVAGNTHSRPDRCEFVEQARAALGEAER